jgi:hypothetical protein
MMTTTPPPTTTITVGLKTQRGRLGGDAAFVLLALYELFAQDWNQ